MSGKLRIYKDKLEGYKRFYSIVKTIKMVTLAKFRQAMARTKSRDFQLRYTEKCFTSKGEEADIIQGATKTLLYVPITTNRGSCGPLNSNTYKYIDGIISKNTKLMVVGKKGNDSLSRLFPKEFTFSIINDMKQAMHFSYASYILENSHSFGDVERTQFIYSRFVSAGVQRQAVYNLPPFDSWVAKISNIASTETEKTNYQFANAVLNLDDVVQRDFYDFHAALMVLNAVSENEHSEYAARLIAVESQMTNIAQLQNRVQYIYNKTRQGSITAALIEILSAMSAMSDGKQSNERTQFWS
jgi:F-type H+-transporting ATPase subunit gamma